MQPPVEFQRKFLGRKLWAKQQELANAITRNRSVSVKGCHGSGKTFTVAGMVPYELIGQRETIVLTVAPTLRQVKNLWSEITAAIQALPMRIPEPTTTGWALSEKCKAIGFSSSKGVNAQGYHGKRVLIIADEAIGISPDLWDAIEGIRSAGDVRIVKLCNPTVPGGPVYEDFGKNRAYNTCITISAFDTPNLAGLTMESLLQLSEEQLDYAPYPWLTRRRWVKEMYYKWGPTNPRFMSRVLGQFPTQSDDSVFMLEWIEAAGLPYEDDDPEFAKLKERGTFIQVGIDVAGAGADETAVVARMAGYIVASDAWSDPDPLDKVLRFLGDLRARFRNSRIIVVGDTVGVGYHFMLAVARAQFECYSFVANEAPIDGVTYVNKKAEAYFQLRAYMKAGLVHGVGDELCAAQLSGMRYTERLGRIEIESKREYKHRMGYSPDRAEALIMAYWKFAQRSVTVDQTEEIRVSVGPY